MLDIMISAVIRVVPSVDSVWDGLDMWHVR
jgi:hypothetical protein